MNIKKRLYFLLLLISFVMLAGSSGYYILFGGQARFMDCFYMTVVSLTTVGYGEVLQVSGNVPAQIYTMVLITFGMGVILYGISTLTALLVEGELSGIIRKNKMLRQISKLQNHTIVCGGGETGRLVIEELVKNKETIVLIEQNPANIARCKSYENLYHIQGDATDDENLSAAGIEAAAGIITTLSSDKDNLYVTMSARMLNRKIRIIARMIDQKLDAKLRKAGANKVVSPNAIGALRMASELIRPAAVDFLDSMLRTSQGDLRIHQITITSNSPMVDKPLSESGLHDQYDLLVLGARSTTGEMAFNPSPRQNLAAGTTLIIMGDVDNIVRAQKALATTETSG